MQDLSLGPHLDEVPKLGRVRTWYALSSGQDCWHEKAGVEAY